VPVRKEADEEKKKRGEGSDREYKKVKRERKQRRSKKMSKSIRISSQQHVLCSPGFSIHWPSK